MRALIVAVVAAVTAVASSAQEPVLRSNGVFLLGALHGLHAQEQGFTFETLRRTIDAIDPHVVVLEVTPGELAGRTETRGRPEYPAVLWPWLAGSPRKAIAMEPDGQTYKAMTGDAAAAAQALTARAPNVVGLWKTYQTATDALLLSYWQDVADTQDQATASVARAYYALQADLYGTAMSTVQDRWDNYMIDEAAEAVRQHPDERVLVIASYRNRHRFEPAIRAAAGRRLVDVAQWPRID